MEMSWTELCDKAADLAVAGIRYPDTEARCGICAQASQPDTRAAFETSAWCQRPDPGKRPGRAAVVCGHYFNRSRQLGAAADPQHAQKKRSKNHLHAEKQHMDQKNLANFKERTETAAGPAPGDQANQQSLQETESHRAANRTPA